MVFKTEESLLERAHSLKGKTVKDLLKGAAIDKGKGAIGNIIEREGFDIANNNDASPDFKELNIELKVFPLKIIAKGGHTSKERTKICSINYKEIINEKWMVSHAKKKLQKILFMFYYYDKDKPINSKILDYTLFQLEDSNEPLIKEDWERTKGLVEEGKAHLLSESQNIILAASRSGAGKVPENQWPEQPNKKFSERARQRSFSLKPSFTKTLWLETNNKKSLVKIRDKFEYNSIASLEKLILEKLNKWSGKSLLEFATSNNIEPKESKNRNAEILRAALGFKDKKRDIKEILQLGLTVKTIPARKKDYMPFEGMSFSYQPLKEILDEIRFDESEFYSYLQGFLFIPLLRETREEKNLSKIIIGKSFIWRPIKKQLLEIQLEWEKYYEVIKSGIVLTKKKQNNKKGFILKNNLPNESETNFIHMRPHARDSDDIDQSLPEIGITKQCFWFNKLLIQSLILKYAS